MVKQRFQVLFRRWLFTVMKMVGPILLFEGLCFGPAAPSVCAPQHLGFAAGSTVGFPAHSSVVLAMGIRRVVMLQTAQGTRILE